MLNILKRLKALEVDNVILQKQIIELKFNQDHPAKFKPGDVAIMVDGASRKYVHIIDSRVAESPKKRGMLFLRSSSEPTTRIYRVFVTEDATINDVSEAQLVHKPMAPAPGPATVPLEGLIR